MFWSLWKNLTHCIAIATRKKERREGSVVTEVKNRKKTLILSELQENKLKEALEEASQEGSLRKSRELGSASWYDKKGFENSISIARLHTQHEFLQATSIAAENTFETEDSIPDLRNSFTKFLTMYPEFQKSENIDQIRSVEYEHLSGSSSKVCLDYCGFGLFSHLQNIEDWESSTFNLSVISANLNNYALDGKAEKGTAEHDIRSRIMDYLNVSEDEYELIFTKSRGYAFQLLAETYPFQTNRKLLTMFDHESQSVNWMVQSAKQNGAKVYHACFRWPTLKVCDTELKRQIKNKKRRKKGSAVGLFVFPVQSRVSGAKYSYQWMSFARQNNWHVLLDAGALGPKDMDTFGLSLFRPDFIITSFYRVFGFDPTGFGCLLINKSVVASLRSQCVNCIVKIMPDVPQYLGNSNQNFDRFLDDVAVVNSNNQEPVHDTGNIEQLPAFSGAYTSEQVRDVFQSQIDDDFRSDTIYEEKESVSVGDLMKSPIFSEEDLSDGSFWIDLGRSPFESDNSEPFERSNGGSPVPLPWFSGRMNHNWRSPRAYCRESKHSICGDGYMTSNRTRNDRTAAFNSDALPASQELEQVEETPEEGQDAEEDPNHKNVRKDGKISPNKKLQEENEIREEIISDNINSVNEAKLNNTGKAASNLNSSITEIEEEEEIFMKEKESAIRRETEGEFRLLGRREGNRNLSLQMCEKHSKVLNNLEEEEIPSFSLDYDNTASIQDEEEYEWRRAEPEMICRQLDHVDIMGLSLITLRFRCLINWFITSLLQLRFPSSGGGRGTPLIHIYGPKIKYERGGSVAFNIMDSSSQIISPQIVLKLADRNGISLGIGFLSHIHLTENQQKFLGHAPSHEPLLNGNPTSADAIIQVEVVTVTLGFFTSFEDVYKAWKFVAKFLNPMFAQSDQFPPATTII